MLCCTRHTFTKVPAVEECDATGVALIDKAWYKNYILLSGKILLIASCAE